MSLLVPLASDSRILSIDFKKDQGIPKDLVQIDDGSGWFRRRKKVKIDQSKKRAHNLIISLKSSE